MLNAKKTKRLRRPDYFNTLLGLLLRRLFWFLFLLVGWLVGWLVEKVFCRRGYTLKCDFVVGAGVGDEVQISWCAGGWGGRSAPPQVHITITTFFSDD